MLRINSLHNKTKEIDINDMPYNNKNYLLKNEDLINIFKIHGLENIKINNINLFRTAFVHQSYCTMKNLDFKNSNSKCPEDCLPLQDMSYERLEFLGDSILEMIVTSYLFERYPDQNEGFLSKLRTKIVNGKMLGFLANKLELNKYAIISKQVEESNGRNNYKIMEDIFEALLGALFIDNDNNYDIAYNFVIYILENYLDFSDLITTKNNYKDILIYYMQHHLQDVPKFLEIDITTKDSSKIFTYCIKNKNNTVIAKSTGNSKKEAENNTALEALKHYNVDIYNLNF
ncbi:putative dsRNA-binding protein [bacterium]|nr:putative dsRNA-binding protein [bacterium]|tara:strand:+ start:437 stop:1297 length:861 start_codon:yes stop_codon:yes gene_type:complete